MYRGRRFCEGPTLVRDGMRGSSARLIYVNCGSGAACGLAVRSPFHCASLRLPDTNWERWTARRRQLTPFCPPSERISVSHAKLWEMDAWLTIVGWKQVRRSLVHGSWHHYSECLVHRCVLLTLSTAGQRANEMAVGKIYHYFSEYPRDSLSLKSFVAVFWYADLTLLCLVVT